MWAAAEKAGRKRRVGFSQDCGCVSRKGAGSKREWPPCLPMVLELNEERREDNRGGGADGLQESWH